MQQPVFFYTCIGVLLIIAPVFTYRLVGMFNRSCGGLSCFLRSWCRRPGNRSVWKIIAICRPGCRLGIIWSGNRPGWEITIGRTGINRSCYWSVGRIISIARIWIDRFNNGSSRIISVARVGIHRPYNRSITIISINRVWINRPCNGPVLTRTINRTVWPACDGAVIIVVVKSWQWPVNAGCPWMIPPEQISTAVG